MALTTTRTTTRTTLTNKQCHSSRGNLAGGPSACDPRYPNYEQLTTLKGAAVRAHAALSHVLMATTAHAAQLEAPEAAGAGAGAAGAAEAAAGVAGAAKHGAASGAAGRERGLGGGGGVGSRKEDMEKLEEWLSKLDQDGDGAVDRSELLAVILAVGGSEQQCNAIWANLDLDGDGALTVQEIATALKVRQCLFETEHIPALVAIATTTQPRGLCYSVQTLWTLATFTKLRAPLGKAMAVETAVSALRRALDNGGLRAHGAHTAAAAAPSTEAAATGTPLQRSGATRDLINRQWWLRVAEWAAATIWLLAYDDNNCHRALHAVGELLVSLAADAEPCLQTMAMGAVVRLIMLPTTMATALHELGALDVLLRVGQSVRANPQLRLMCSATLSFLSFAEGAEGTVAITRRLETSHEVERTLVSLVKARRRPGLQTVGCRRLALVALTSLKKCKVVLALGGTAAVLDVLRHVHNPGKTAHPPNPGEAVAEMDGTPTPTPAQPGRGKLSGPSGHGHGHHRLWCLGHPELLRCAINALLNLSIEASNQVVRSE